MENWRVCVPPCQRASLRSSNKSHTQPSFNESFDESFNESFDDSFDESFDDSFDDSFDEVFDESFDDSFDDSFDESFNELVKDLFVDGVLIEKFCLFSPFIDSFNDWLNNSLIPFSFPTPSLRFFFIPISLPFLLSTLSSFTHPCTCHATGLNSISFPDVIAYRFTYSNLHHHLFLSLKLLPIPFKRHHEVRRSANRLPERHATRIPRVVQRIAVIIAVVHTRHDRFAHSVRGLRDQNQR